MQQDKVVFKIEGMDCAEEVRAIKNSAKNIIDHEALSFDVINGKLTVDLSQNNLVEKDIICLVKNAGFRAIPWQTHLKSSEEKKSWFSRNGRTLFATLSAVFIIIAYAIHAQSSGWLGALSEAGGGYPLSSIILYCFAIITGAWFVFPKAILSIRKMRADMNLLMMIAVIGAIFIQQWFEAAAVSCLFSVALLLESWSVGKARKAINALMSLAPETAKVYTCCGSVVEKQLSEVEIDTICIVNPGERIPFDGVVSKGAGYINQAPITGESIPVNKIIGSEVFSGSINGNNSIEMKVTKLAENSTLARIISMVEDAQSRRAVAEQWVESFAAKYTPIMILFAILVAIVPPLLFAGSWVTWFYEALVILVIACPCALVISTPVSIVAGLSRAASNGILIKGGNYLERPSKIKVIAFDKTGTLTKGQPVVQNAVPLGWHTKEQLISNAAALELNSDHPLARAVIQYAIDLNIEHKKSESFEIIQGKGAQGIIDGKQYWLGSHKFLHEKLSKDDACLVHDRALAFENQGHSVIVVGCDDHICGLISIADEIRDEAKDVMQELKSLGVQKLIMLTGDNQGTARTVASHLDIEYKAELLPEDKVKYIEELTAKYKNVAMVGDGINDTPAMAASELGIAMGVAGSDAAIETADITLMSDELTKLPWLIQHSKRTLNIIKQNIYFSLGLKAIFIVLALLGIATLWMAIAADMGASLIVIANGLRLLK
ncbi:MAG: Cd2+/Zn2+-exporting ATPase, partial [Francisellaceae bacterium]